MVQVLAMSHLVISAYLMHCVGAKSSFRPPIGSIFAGQNRRTIKRDALYRESIYTSQTEMCKFFGKELRKAGFTQFLTKKSTPLSICDRRAKRNLCERWAARNQPLTQFFASWVHLSGYVHRGIRITDSSHPHV